MKPNARRVCRLLFSLFGILPIAATSWAGDPAAQVTALGTSGWVHQGSGSSPVSAHNRYALLSNPTSGAAEVVNATNGQVVYNGVTFSADCAAWDSADDDLYYY